MQIMTSPWCFAVNESFIRGQADRLISSGLFGAGYDTVIVDGESVSLL